MNFDKPIIAAIEAGEFEEARQLAKSNPFTLKVLNFSTEVCAFDLLWELLQLAIDRGLDWDYYLRYNVIISGRVDVIDFLFTQKGLNPNLHSNDFDRTILMEACLWNQLDIVQRLLICGADPEQEDVNGQNAFFYSVVSGVNIFRLLLLHTKKLNFIDKDGRNLLHDIFHSMVASQEVFDEILNLGLLDINAQDNFGDTALHLAIKHFDDFLPFSDRIQKLIRHPDSDLAIRNNKGKTALDLCKSKEWFDEEIQEAFEKRGIAIPRP